MNFLKYLILAFMLTISVGHVHAESIGISRFYPKDEHRIKIEKKALTQWIVKTTKGKTDDAKATKILDYVYQFASEYGLDPILVLSMMKKESTFNERAVSKSNARGLLQVIPRWHRDKIKGRSLSDIKVGIQVGALVLKEYMDLKDGKLLPALNQYSGGAGKKYFASVAQTHREISRTIVEYSFANEQPIVVTHNIHKPVINETATATLVAAY